MHVATNRQTEAPLRRWAVLGLASAGVVLITVAAADASVRREPVERVREVGTGPLEVSVRIGSRTAPLYQKASAPDRWYLEARERARYEVVVRNTSSERIAFVMSVDGLNVINGERTSLGAHEAMYVLDPFAQTTIKGWRRSLSTVNRFVFVDEERSYVERMGRGNGDLGWIRVAAFREQRPVGVWRDGGGRAREESPRASGKAAPEASRGPRAGVQSEGDLAHPGTGWGQEEKDWVRRVDFDPQPFACATAILRYEYKPALVALGILPWRGSDRDRLWERENGLYGFAVPPPGR
jgi:hypothetical protein